MDARSAISESVAANQELLLKLSHEIHAQAEIGFEEHRSVALIVDSLDDAHFSIDVGVGGLDTAFVAEAGDGPDTIALLAEYDALPDLGHACGHNLISAISTGAAMALAPIASDLGIRLKLIGTPAEEGGGGKILLLERGVFEGVRAALMVHPGPVDLEFMPTLATTRMSVTYSGTAAHASAFPERAVNAADAATIAQVAIGMLRQQLPGDARVHGILEEAGVAPNVIPDRAILDYLVRGADVGQLAELEERVTSCFKAGAVASGAKVGIERTMPVYAEFVPDDFLTGAYRRNAEQLGRTFREIDERVLRAAGSTDMGNVSQTIPSAHPMIGLGREAGTIHSAGFAAAAVSELGDRVVRDGATALAWTVAELAQRKR